MCYSHLKAAAKDAAHRPKMHRTGPQNKESPDPKGQ